MPTLPYKTSAYLTTSQAIAEYLKVILDDPESDDKDLLVALCNVAEATSN
jgi:DNA-binding phage protein